jgi:hypothetical protein
MVERRAIFTSARRSLCTPTAEELHPSAYWAINNILHRAPLALSTAYMPSADHLFTFHELQYSLRVLLAEVLGFFPVLGQLFLPSHTVR